MSQIFFHPIQIIITLNYHEFNIKNGFNNLFFKILYRSLTLVQVNNGRFPLGINVKEVLDKWMFRPKESNLTIWYIIALQYKFYLNFYMLCNFTRFKFRGEVFFQSGSFHSGPTFVFVGIKALDKKYQQYLSYLNL